jgi:hypothetical protein
LPVPRVPAAGLGAPAPCAYRLLRPRPRSAPRRRDPRCSLRCAPGQRFPTPMRTRGARELRSDRPPAAPADGRPTLPHSFPIFIGWGTRIRPAGGAAMVSGGHGVPSVRIRGGVSVTRSFADTEGPHSGPHCWVVAEEVSARRERGRASAERPRTRRAKQSHAVRKGGKGPPRHRQNKPHAVKQ